MPRTLAVHHHTHVFYHILLVALLRSPSVWCTLGRAPARRSTPLEVVVLLAFGGNTAAVLRRFIRSMKEPPLTSTPQRRILCKSSVTIPRLRCEGTIAPNARINHRDSHRDRRSAAPASSRIMSRDGNDTPRRNAAALKLVSSVV